MSTISKECISDDANECNTAVTGDRQQDQADRSSGATERDARKRDTLRPPSFDDTAAAGDWALFRSRCAFVDTNGQIDVPSVLALKQRFALAYLGARAQARGGVYMRSHPSVFNTACVEKLGRDNAAARFARYPWLERLLALLQELDQDQYAASPMGNIASLGKQRHRLHVVPASMV